MIRVHKKRDGLLVIRQDGTCRYLTNMEAIVYRITGYLPKDLTHAPE